MPGIVITCPHCGKQSDSVHVKYCAKSRAPRAFKPSNEMHDESLDCYWCGKLFKDFKALALHVQNHGVEGFDEAVNYYLQKGELYMLQQPGAGKTQSQRGGRDPNRPKPQVPFVSVEDLHKDPSRAKILMVQTQNTGFNDIIVKIAIAGRSYFLGLKASNPNYESLFRAFGADENEWIGQEFMIGLNWNEFYEKNFVHIFDAPAPKTKAK